MTTNASPIVPANTARMLMDFQPAILADGTPESAIHVLTEKVFPRHADVIQTHDLPTLSRAGSSPA